MFDTCRPSSQRSSERPRLTGGSSNGAGPCPAGRIEGSDAGTSGRTIGGIGGHIPELTLLYFYSQYDLLGILCHPLSRTGCDNFGLDLVSHAFQFLSYISAVFIARMFFASILAFFY